MMLDVGADAGEIVAISNVSFCCAQIGGTSLLTNKSATVGEKLVEQTKTLRKYSEAEELTAKPTQVRAACLAQEKVPELNCFLKNFLYLIPKKCGQSLMRQRY